jgi:hypothetical protein
MLGKTLQKLLAKNKKNIKELEWDETEEKYWMVLRNKCDPHGSHTITGLTVNGLLDNWRRCEPCNCRECE